jgi:uncharacterized membrane protein YphA (DoxX/SURF4 family)
MKKQIRWGLGLLLGGVFVVAGILKAIDPEHFFHDVQNYDLIPWWAAIVALAFYLPWLEIICGIAVLARPLRSGALILVSAMLLTFIAALVVAWARGLDISCGCFGGTASHPRYLLWIGRDVGLLVVALAMLLTRNGFSEND